MNDIPDFFDNDDMGRTTGDINEVLEHLNYGIEAGKIDMPTAIESLLAIIKPGSTDLSKDIRHSLVTALHLLGHSEMGEAIHAAWFTILPWGMAIHLGFDPDFTRDHTEAERRDIVRALWAVMRAGGTPVEMTPEGRIRFVDTDHSLGVEDIVSDFRRQLDDALGPDAPVEGPHDKAVTDWMTKWAKPKEENDQ